MDFFAGQGNASADVLERGARVVRNLILRENAAPDLPGKKGEGLQSLEITGEGSLLFLIPGRAPVSLDAAYVVEKACDPKKLRNGKRAADLQGTDGVGHVLVAPKGGGTFAEQHGERVRGLGLGQLDFPKVCHGHEGPAHISAGLGRGFPHKGINDLGIFQGL